MTSASPTAPTANRARLLPLARFAVAGLANTAITFGLFQLLVFAVPYQVAYAGSYATGIGIGYLLAATWVFDRRPTGRGLLTYPVVDLSMYLVGALLLAVLVDRLGVPERLAPLAVIAAGLPLKFVLSRVVVHRTSPPA